MPLYGSIELGMAQAPSGSRGTSPTEGQLYYDTDDNVLYAYNGTSWGRVSAVTATGGTIDDTSVSGYKIHKFTSDGTFTVSGGTITCEVKVLGAGGGGGAGNGKWAGGGGGGGYTTGTYSLGSGTYSVTVGALGAGQTTCNNDLLGGVGGNSVFDNGTTLTGYGGAGGGQHPEESSGAAGGTGSGGSSSSTGGTGDCSSGDGSGGGGQNGGGSTYGSGAAGVNNGVPGNHATGYGNGGGGGHSCQGGHRGGGDGSPGYVEIRYAN